MNKYLQRILLISLATLSFVSGSLQAADEKARPNIVFFLADDQRNDQLGCYGHPFVKTPNLDKLAARGTRFTNAFVTTSICAASRATIFTGLVERSHHYTFGTPAIAQDLVSHSYPVVMKNAGYKTGFVGKFGVGFAGGTKQAFDFFQPINRNKYFKPQPDGSLRHTTQLSGDAAIQFIKANKDEPFMLSVSFNATHAEDGDKVDHFPWPEVMDGMYEDIEIAPPRLNAPEIFASQPEFLRESLNRERFFWRWDTQEKYEKNIRSYYRMLSGIDHVVGRVIDTLEELSLDENTIVIYTGDNGYYMAQRGFAGKWSHYEESLRVPMIIADPRVKDDVKGQVRDEVVLNLDLASTFVRAAGIELPKQYQGEALGGLVAGKTPKKWRTDFFCEHLMDVPGRIPKWEGVRAQRWVYANYFQDDFEFLHDLESDPDQLINLATVPAHKSQLKKMRDRCLELRDSYGGEYSYKLIPTNRYLREKAEEEKKTQPAKLTPPIPSAKAKPQPKLPANPNVVLIISDDQAWTDYSFLAHPVIKTPRIDQLARESATFTRGYVPQALCRSSLATLVSGLYPRHHKITGNDPTPLGAGAKPGAYQELRNQLIANIDRIDTVPRMLQEKGYLSHQSGKWWEGHYSRGGFTHGMTHGDPERGGRHGDVGLQIGRQGMEPVHNFIKESKDQEKPFFVWYAPFLPHTPHNPPERLLVKYRAEDRPVQLAKYYAMCEWFDETCGQLLDIIDDEGLRKNTVIIYVTDNGWIQRTPDMDLGSAWRSSYAPRSKQSANEGGIRTPIMVRWPGQVRPGKRSQLVSSIDIAPTILELAGLEKKEHMYGKNLIDVAQGRTSPHDALFGESYAHDIADLNDHTKTLLYRYVIQEDWKLLLSYDGIVNRYKWSHPERDLGPQLYNLRVDPAETDNRASTNPEIVKELTELLYKHWDHRKN